MTVILAANIIVNNGCCYRAITLFILALCPAPVKPKFLVAIQHITAGYHNAYTNLYSHSHLGLITNPVSSSQYILIMKGVIHINA